MARTAKRYNLKSASVVLEPTFSLTQVGAYLGLTHSPMADLVRFGRIYGARLHPQRGGLYPTFLGAKLRRVPLSAIQRHLRHMARLAGEAEPPPIIVLDGRLAHGESPAELSTEVAV